MNVKKLAKNIIKPYFIDDIKISKININSSIAPYKKLICNFSTNLKSKTTNLNNVNILELINWINSFKYMNVIDWNDDKEFDFSNIEEIILHIDFDIEKYLINEKNYNFFDFYQLVNDVEKVVKSQQFNYFSLFFEKEILNYISKNEIFLI